MDDSDSLEARNARLAALKTDDPVAWAICSGHRGLITISAHLDMPLEEVQKALNRLTKAHHVKKVRYQRTFAYRPHSQEMKRLSRRAYALRKEEEGL